MILLVSLIAITVVFFLLDAWAIAAGARWLKSTRGRFGLGLLTVTALAATNIGFAILGTQLPVAATHPLVLQLALFLLQIVIVLVLVRKVFALSWGRSLGLFGIYLLLGVLQVGLALAVFRPYVAEAFILPTGSMAPTLNVGDRFLANKLEQPRRWDLIVYKAPGMVGLSCKRLVGLPGEELKFENGNLLVNGATVAAPAVVAGKYHMVRPSRYSDGESIKLGSDEFFAIGDHTELSYDSRMTGPAKLSSLVGVVDLLYWPIPRIAILK